MPDAGSDADAGVEPGVDAGTNSCGTVLWTATTDPQNDGPLQPVQVAIDREDDVVVAGTHVYGAAFDGCGSNGRWTRTYGVDGALAWAVDEDEPDRSISDMASAPSGNVFETGGDYSVDLPQSWVTKRDPSGSALWTIGIESRWGAIATAIAAWGDDGAIVAGSEIRTVGGRNAADAFVLALAADGAEAWRADRLGPFPNDVTVDPDGVVYVLQNGSAATLRAIDPSGAILWQVELGDVFAAFAPHPNGGVVVAGTVPDSLTLWHFDSTGHEIWRATHEADGRVFAVAVDAGGNVATTGEAPATPGTDISLSTFDPEGALSWTCEYDIDEADVGASVAFDSRGDLVVAGYTGLSYSGGVCIVPALWIRKLVP